MESAGKPGDRSQPASCCMIRSASVAMMLRFGTINWVLGGRELTETRGGLSEIEGRLSGTGRDMALEIDKEELLKSGDYPLGILRIPSVIVANKEETLLSASRDYI
jgi:hypothetical protein